MKAYKYKKIFIFFVTTLFLFTQQAVANKEQKLYQLKMKKAQLIKQIKQFQDRKIKLQTSINSYKTLQIKNLTAIQKRVKETEKNLRKEQIKKAISLGKLKKQQYLLHIKKRQLQQFMKRNRILINDFKNLIKKSAPMISQPETAAADALLSESRLSTISGLEIYNRLWTIARSGIMHSFDSQTTTDHNQPKFRLLRLGRILQYRSDRQEHASVKIKTYSNDWIWSLKGLTLKNRLAIHKAVKMVDGKKAPDFIILPILANLFKLEK